jgi:hypothetical protein
MPAANGSNPTPIINSQRGQAIILSIHSFAAIQTGDFPRTLNARSCAGSMGMRLLVGHESRFREQVQTTAILCHRRFDQAVDFHQALQCIPVLSLRKPSSDTLNLQIPARLSRTNGLTP